MSQSFIGRAAFRNAVVCAVAFGVLVGGVPHAAVGQVVVANPAWRGGWGGGWGGGGGTVAGNYYNGLGNALQGAGQFNLATAQATTQMQQTRSMAIDNHVKQTQAYFQLREMNRQQQAILDGPKRTPEDWARINRAPRPQRLSSSEFDPVTGALRWPLVLQAPEFNPQRDQVQTMLSALVASGAPINGEQYAALTADLTAMRATLKSRIDQIPSGQYMQARHFLDAIDTQATSDPGQQAAAR